MKIYSLAKLCCVLAAFCVGANLAFAQVADPQRPDDSPQPEAAAPETARQVRVPFDPQRPDENPPAAVGPLALTGPKEIHLTLTPAPEPVPALKYELLPGPLERTPGNGATNYYRAMLHLQQAIAAVPKEESQKFYQDYEAIFDKPLREMPKAEMEKWVGYYQSALAEAKIAAYREECNFNLRVQDLRGMETISFLLHDFQTARDLSRALRMRARLEISNGKLDDALETVRQGMQLGRDTAQPDLLINGLIGVAIVSTMQEEVLEIISQPGSPNLYWALASLPRPLIDIRRGLRFEMDMPERMFPFLKDPETAQRSPEEWQKLMVESLHQINEYTSAASSGVLPQRRIPDWQSRLAATAGLMTVYPDAKRRLLEEGFDREELEKMPVAQVVAIQAARAQKKAYHNVFKWTSLPYSLQGTHADETQKEMVAAMGGPGQITAADPLFLARMLIPAAYHAMGAELRVHSQLAALQTIEAIRMHAAVSGGRLPNSLADITVVPVPLNPATDKPFPYELKEGVARLTIAPPSQHLAGEEGKVYVIRMARGK